MSDARSSEQSQTMPVAVVDTNVMLEAMSCVDMVKLYDTNPEIDPAGPAATLRRQKARESLLLSMHLSEIGATTFSLYETIRIALREVPPDDTGTFENHAMTIWVHYVQEHVVPGWDRIGPAEGTGEPVGSGADELLVDHAKAYGIPLISHEGVTVSGVDERCGLRRKATKKGVTVVTPRQFYAGMNELLAAALFMQRFRQGAEQYILGRSHPELMRESMLYLQGYYLHVLYGITAGRAEALPVELPSRGDSNA